jgi:hypothetical protein
MRRPVLTLLPWLLAIVLAGAIVFLLTRIVRPWETRRVDAAPVVMAIRRIAQFNPITSADRTRWMLWARGQLAVAARQAGIESKAREHARELITSAAEAFGWKAEIVFE